MLRTAPTSTQILENLELDKDYLSKYNGKVIVFFTPLVYFVNKDTGKTKLVPKLQYWSVSSDTQYGNAIMAFSIITVNIKNGKYNIIKEELEKTDFPYMTKRFREMYPTRSDKKAIKAGEVMSSKVLSAVKDQDCDFLALVDTHLSIDEDSYKSLLAGGNALIGSDLKAFATNMTI